MWGTGAPVALPRCGAPGCRPLNLSVRIRCDSDWQGTVDVYFPDLVDQVGLFSSTSWGIWSIRCPPCIGAFGVDLGGSSGFVSRTGSIPGHVDVLVCVRQPGSRKSKCSSTG